MKQILALALLVVLVFSKAEFQQGTDETITWQSTCQHTLQCDTTPGRYMDVTVDFPQAFSVAPQVVLSIRVLDYHHGNNLGFEVQLESVTNKGFTYRATAPFADEIGTLRVDWVAFLASNVQVKYAKIPIDMNEKGDKDVYTFEKSVEFDQPLVCPEQEYAGVAFVTGVNVSGAQQVSGYASSIEDEYGMVVSFDTESGVYEWISVVVVGACADKMETFSVGKQSGDGASADIDALNSGSGHRSIPYEVNLYNQQNLESGFIFFGLTTLDKSVDDSKRLRLSYKEDISSASIDGTVNVELITWANTFIAGAYLDGFTLRVDEQCAIVYSECNYQGEQLKICSGEPVHSFDLAQWGDNKIQSVKVPAGRTLTLFDAEKLDGAYTQVTKNIECHTAGWVFT